MIVMNNQRCYAGVFGTIKGGKKNDKKGVKKGGIFLKVKRPTLLLTLYLLTH
jgi:hypothetical protein